MTTYEPEGEIQASERFLIDSPTHGWRIFAWKDAVRVRSGNLLLPEFSGKTIRVADVTVAVSKGRVVRLDQIAIFEWPFDAIGRIEGKKLMPTILDKLNKVGDTQEIKPTEADTLGISKALGLKPGK